MSDKNVLFFGPEINFVQEILRQQGVNCFAPDQLTNEEDYKKIEIAVAPGNFELPASKIEPFSELKLIVVAGGGRDKIDIGYTADKSIQVLTASSNSIATAEFTLFNILYLTRAIYNKKSFDKNETYGFGEATGIDLFDRSVGIVGLGRIGCLLAKMLRGFNVKVNAYDPHIPEEIFSDHNVNRCEFDELLANSEVICVLCPANEETHHMFSTQAFEKMQQGAFFINTARGSIVDEKALVEALKNNKLKGCALDVFENEPLAENSPLRQFENCYLTPHIAGHTIDSRSRLYQNITNEILDYFNNKENAGLFDDLH